MYNQHFGLDRAPFKITPDTRTFFTGAGRGEVLEALVYAVTSGEGIIKVVGEVGTGKTMICRMLEVKLPAHVEIVYLANPSLTPEDILQAIALEMHIDAGAGANRLRVLHAIQRHLLDKHARGEHVVVLVEEAQSMPNATLEEIRLLSNLETQQSKLLQIVLFGQPELDEKLSDPAIRQLRERITHGFYLAPFTTADVREYVDFRLRHAGFRGREPFRSNAYTTMSKASEGLTRRVNILADKALLAAYADDTHDVERRHVRIAIDDTRFERRRRIGWAEAALATGFVLLGATLTWATIGTDFGQSVVAAVLPARESATIEPAPSPVAADPAPPVEAAVRTDPPTRPPVRAVLATPDAVASAQASPVATRADVEATAQPAVPSAVAAAGSGTAAAPAPVRSPESAPAPEPAPAPVSAPVATQAPAPVSAQRQRASAASVPGTRDFDAPASAAEPAPKPEPQPVVAGQLALSDSLRVSETPRTSVRPPPAAAQSTPVPPGPEAGPAGSLIDRRLAATRDWLETAERSHFSIQLLLSDVARRENLEDFLAARAQGGQIGSVYVYETEINGRAWYAVLYGEFSSFSAAREVLENLPSELSRHQPFIRNVSDVAIAG